MVDVPSEVGDGAVAIAAPSLIWLQMSALDLPNHCISTGGSKRIRTGSMN
jgi:hypothetical protein